MEKSITSGWFNAINALFFIVVTFLVLYPIYQLLVISLNDPTDAMRGGLYWWPREFSLDSYRAVFDNDYMMNAFLVSVLRTVAGAACSVLATGMFAYGLTKPKLKFRRAYLLMAMFTMFFNGGLIPYFLLIQNIGLMDKFLVYIIPALINVWNMIIMKTFFESLPEALEESAMIEGYNYLQIFWKIVLPTSMPIVATIALFNGVAQWNAWFDAYLYITNQDLLPMQTILMRMISQNSAAQEVSKFAQHSAGAARITAESLKTTTMIVVMAPIVLVYPFLQRYFVKGVMIGAIKG
ncbi:carbohydrate ABC transporter permease [Paenibacillaceae bacterium WGS1546]|uniref:carbohydrate ABC transporter permease n=1 Tax=Cohnella sp. WGS1546 TaxID=3366810 RepID=UPI00372D3558